MRARRKGTNNPFVNIDKVQLQNSDILFSAEVMEFEPHPEDYVKSEYPDDYWEKLEHQAAIAAMQEIVSRSNLSWTYAEVAEYAIAYAESLIKKLKGG